MGQLFFMLRNNLPSGMVEKAVLMDDKTGIVIEIRKSSDENCANSPLIDNRVRKADNKIS